MGIPKDSRVRLQLYLSYSLTHLIIRYDQLAYKNSALIINSSGFDSIPSEIGPYLASKSLRAAFGDNARLGRSVSAWKVQTGISGGTIDSILSMTDAPRDQVKAALDDWGLSPGAQAIAPTQYLISLRIVHFSERKTYTWTKTSL